MDIAGYIAFLIITCFLFMKRIHVLNEIIEDKNEIIESKDGLLSLREETIKLLKSEISDNEQYINELEEVRNAYRNITENELKSTKKFIKLDHEELKDEGAKHS